MVKRWLPTGSCNGTMKKWRREKIREKVTPGSPPRVGWSRISFTIIYKCRSRGPTNTRPQESVEGNRTKTCHPRASPRSGAEERQKPGTAWGHPSRDVSSMHPQCVFDVSSMCPGCVPGVSSMPPRCLLDVPSMRPRCLLDVPSMGAECVLDVSWISQNRNRRSK